MRWKRKSPKMVREGKIGIGGLYTREVDRGKEKGERWEEER